MSEEEEKKDVVKQGEQGLRVSGGEGAPAGFGDLDPSEDIKVPRLQVLQMQSKMVVDEKGSLGQLVNSISKENFGDDVEFIPLFMFKSRVKFEIGKGMVLMSRDNVKVDVGLEQYERYVGKHVEEVPHDQNPEIPAINWDGKNPPSFNLVYNFMAVLPGERTKEFPMCLSFMKTAVPTAKDFLGQARLANEDIFSRVYKLSSTKETNDKGTFAVPVVEFSRKCTDEEYEYAKRISTELYEIRRKIDVDLTEEPVATEE